MSVELGPGTEVGPYRIVSELGRGGMGLVFRALDPALDRGVALKLLTIDGDPLQAARLRVEARSTASLRHPGIVRILGAGVRGPHAWVAMELVDGEQLAERVTRAPLGAVQAVRVAADLADALAHAHARGIVHRDLKPHNVILQPDGRPVLIDFGLAKLLGRSSLALTTTGELLGTPGYMAPEQVDPARGAIDARTDVYGLGATLYHLLTGGPPVRGERLLGQLQRVLDGQPDLAPVRAAAPGLEPILARCLAKAPADRYSTAAELRDALRAWLPAPRAARAVSRTVRAASLMAWALPSAIASGGWAWSALRAPAPAPQQAPPADLPGRAQAERRLEQAIEAALAGDVRAARAAFDAAHTADPSWALPFRRRGRWLVRLDPRAAIEALRRAVELEPADGDAWQALALILQLQDQLVEARQARERGDALPGWRRVGSGRREDLERALEEAPDSPALRCLLGHACLTSGDLDGAERAARRSLERDPLAREPVVVLATVAELRGDLPGAFASLARALRTDPDGSTTWAHWVRLSRVQPAPPALQDALDPRGLTRRLIRLEDERDPRRLRELIDEALREHPQNRLVWLGEAQALLNEGRACECLALLASFHAREPRNPRSCVLRAAARLRLADFAGCAQDAELALSGAESVAGRQEIRRLLAEAQLGRRRVNEALETWSAAEAEGPLSGAALRSRGLLHLARGALREALRDLDAACAQLAADDPLTAQCVRLSALARAVLERGETPDSLCELAGALSGTLLAPATLILERALERAPTHVEALSLHGLLSCAGSDAGDAPGAAAGRDELRRAVELAPSDPRTWGRLSLALAWAGAGDDAEQAARRAIELDPEQSEGRLARALLLVAAGDLRSSLAELERRRTTHNALVEELALKLLTLVRLELESPSARALLKEALERRPADLELLAAQARQLLLDRDPAAARAVVDHVLSRSPDHLSALLVRGDIAVEQGQLEAARRDVDRAVDVAPTPRTWLSRAAVRAAQGDHRGALADLDLAASRAPDDLQVLLRRALSREATGDARGAQDDRERARALDPVRAAELERRLRR